MARERLHDARDGLRTAAAETGDADAADRLEDLADQLDTAIERDSGPDHGRMARIQTALNDLREGAAADVADTIEAAQDDISAYRETVEGV